MRSNFYLKMALRNIRANKQLYLPYAISTMITVVMFLQMSSLITNEFVRNRGGATLSVLFYFGAIVIGIFSFIFLLYANSFLIKRRKKEVGLYGILGLEKRHVSRILLIESIIVATVSIGTGLAGGAILGRLIFLFLNYLLKLPVQIDYSLNLTSFIATAALFVGIFFVAFLYNVSQVTFSNPIQLLKGEKEGEREPKSNLFLFLLGIILVGAGYWISVTIPDPLAALLYFFVAVVLVILGTYFLFTAGSIYILKAMKKNKKLYYQPRAFISISGMLYRMKQNATGLANIAVLSCMVIIAVGTTVALYVGAEETILNRTPAENVANVFYEDDVTVASMEANMDRVIDVIIDENDTLEVQELQAFKYGSVFGDLVGSTFEMNHKMAQTMILITQDEIKNSEGLDFSLEAGEIYLHDSADFDYDTMQLSHLEFKVTQFEESLTNFLVEESFGQSLLVIVPDAATLDQILQAYEAEEESAAISMMGKIHWRTDGTEEEKASYAEQLEPKITATALVRYDTQAKVRTDWYVMNGGFLFLGIFLGLLFTIGTILITYFKQISEGYDDRNRFQIMQQVGLDKEMIRDTSRSQVVWMFLLPLLVATVHTAFAYPIVYKLLIVFGLNSHTILITSIIGVVLAFSILYWMIYRVTARVYYSIVH